MVRPRPEDAEETLARLEQRTEETLSEMRRLIYGLRPPALDDLGLIPSICQQAQSQGMVNLSAGTKADRLGHNRLLFTVEAPEELPQLPAAVEVACYRIAQESLTNVVRHAHAKTCRRKYRSENSKEMAEEVVLGVDTHLDAHVAVALDELGRRLGEQTVPTTKKGYKSLVSPGRKASAP